MEIKQIYELVNEGAQAVAGEITLPEENLANLVDVGKSIANANGTEAFYKALQDRIGKMYFVDRPYRGQLPKLFMDSWRFGSIVGKVQVDDMEVQENETWEIVNGQSYDPFVVNLPVVSSKFFNKMVTFELDITTPTKQIEQAFISIDEMNRFLSMIQTMVYNSMEARIEVCALGCLANLIAVTINDNGASVVHLLSTYNTLTSQNLTAKQALTDGDFLRYATEQMRLIKKRLSARTSIYNKGGKRRHTPGDLLNVAVLADFASAVETYSYSDTYHNEFVKMPGYDEVAFWQGAGTSFDYDDVSKIKATILIDGDNGTTASFEEGNIVAVMYDEDACGVLQPRKRVTTQYNPKNETYNDFHKWESRYFNDFNEQCVVFQLD